MQQYLLPSNQGTYLKILLIPGQTQRVAVFGKSKLVLMNFEVLNVDASISGESTNICGVCKW